LRAGQLDQRIALQRKAESLSDSGSPSESWSTLAERWAAVDPVQGDERSAAEQWVAREQVKFTIRWSSEVSDFSPLDRIVFPASDAGSSPAPIRSVYDVISVIGKGRNVQIDILAARQVG
jgi:head-tail adaptor